MAFRKERVYTEEQKERKRIYAKNRREALKKSGICIRCGAEKAAEGRLMCERCLEKKRGEAMKRYKRIRAMGKCVGCGKNWAMPHMRLCLPCKIKYSERHAKNAAWYSSDERKAYAKNLRERYKAEGKCVKCGKPTNGVYTMCDKCRELSKERSRQWRIRQKERIKNEVG